MFKIDGPGADPNNEFTEGNPASGIPATAVTAEWLNAIQRELLALLANANVTPDKLDDAQLLSVLGGRAFRMYKETGSGNIDIPDKVHTPIPFTLLELGNAADINLAAGRHTPTVMGNYLYIGFVYYRDNKGAGTNWKFATCNIRKNSGTLPRDYAGSMQLGGSDLHAASMMQHGSTCAGIIDMNGSTDYVDLTAYVETATLDIEVDAALLWGNKLI